MHFITFSRLLGTNGAEIAKKVAAKLNYKVIDTDAIDQKAREMGFFVSVSEADEYGIPLFPQFINNRIEPGQINIGLVRKNPL